MAGCMKPTADVKHDVYLYLAELVSNSIKFGLPAPGLGCCTRARFIVYGTDYITKQEK